MVKYWTIVSYDPEESTFYVLGIYSSISNVTNRILVEEKSLFDVLDEDELLEITEEWFDDMDEAVTWNELEKEYKKFILKTLKKNKIGANIEGVSGMIYTVSRHVLDN